MNKLQLIGLGVAILALLVSGFSLFTNFRLSNSVDENRDSIIQIVDFINNAIQQTPQAEE